MRHANKIKKLGRTHAHRKATMASLSTALLRHKRITTTLAKAKALRSFVEPVINRAKEDTTTNRRQAFRRLQDKEAVKTLFGEVADALGDRPGGYTRVVKLGQRPGDAAEMAVIELVDFNDVKPEGGTAKKKTRRGGSRRRSKSAAAPAAAPKAEAAETEADDLTKLWGVGKVFATALRDAGLDSFDAIAEADLDALRAAIAEGSEASDESANEETWSEQARYAAAGDWDGLDAYIETLKEEGGTAHTPPEEVPPAEPEAEAEPATDAAAETETAEPEPAAPEDETPIENPAAPEVAPQANPHPDAEQGAPPGEGPPPPEADPETRGSSEHRG